MDTKKSIEALELKRRVHAVIEQFLKEGTIFRAPEPIGGMPAYYVSCILNLFLFNFSILSELGDWLNRFV